MKRIKSQQGSYSVEFALTSAVFMFVLFAVIEVGRLLYTWSALNLATQRGARIAVVCPVHDDFVSRTAIFGSETDGSSRILPGVTAENIAISYTDQDGLETGYYPEISYVTVSIVGYTHQLLIPGLSGGLVPAELLSPAFSTTLPAESLGYDPSSETRICFA